MGTFTLQQSAAFFMRAQQAFEDALDELSLLDAAIGDGDHGVSMVKGFRSVAAAISKNTFPDIGAMWMEAGRVDLCKASGFNYRDIEREDGIYFAVAEAACRYRAPARFDDEVIVKTWIEEANTRIVTFAYEMRLAEGDGVLATGTTRHVFVTRAMQRTRLPEKYRAMLGIAEKA